MPMTTEQIRERGLAALRKELGSAGLIRFLKHFQLNRGDYTEDRRQSLAGLSIEELRGRARQSRIRKKSRRA